jgi:hypothetical protein
MISDLVTAKHLSRKAMIYIRQSTPQQVMTNQESLRLQYALRQRASDLGWLEMNIEVVDVDLGLSGATSSNREGFKAHPSPHFAADRNPPNNPLLTSISANRCISGSSLCSGMFGISS